MGSGSSYILNGAPFFLICFIKKISTFYGNVHVFTGVYQMDVKQRVCGPARAIEFSFIQSVSLANHLWLSEKNPRACSF